MCAILRAVRCVRLYGSKERAGARINEALTISSSWPGLTGPSTSWNSLKKVMDARHKAGHDGTNEFRLAPSHRRSATRADLGAALIERGRPRRAAGSRQDHARAAG